MITTHMMWNGWTFIAISALCVCREYHLRLLFDQCLRARRHQGIHEIFALPLHQMVIDQWQCECQQFLQGRRRRKTTLINCIFVIQLVLSNNVVVPTHHESGPN